MGVNVEEVWMGWGNESWVRDGGEEELVNMG